MSKDKKKIWMSKPHLSGEEIKYIKTALEANWVAPVGPDIDAFEFELEAYLENSRHIAAMNSGTSALHLALILAGVGRDDVVFCQSLTFAASAFPIKYQGAKPVFIDSEAQTWNLCPNQLKKALAEYKRKGKLPKAIVAVHLYGMPYKVDEIHKLGSEYGVPIIEDSAEALGSCYAGLKCGSFGEYALISFNGNKIITTSAGGALVCRDLPTKNRAIKLASQAKEKELHYEHTEIGFNYRMSNILAGIGLGQLEVLDERVEQRRSIFAHYKQELAAIVDFQNEPDNCISNRWLTCILTKNKTERNLLLAVLEKENIDARPLWKPLHMQPVFAGCKSYTNGVSASLFDNGLCLPSSSDLSQEELFSITNIIRNEL